MISQEQTGKFSVDRFTLALSEHKKLMQEMVGQPSSGVNFHWPIQQESLETWLVGGE